MKKLLTVLALLGLMAGCATSSPTPRLFTVDMSPSAEAGSPVNIRISRLRVAEPLQSKRILIKKSATEIEYYATAQWAANLDEVLREKMAAEFGPTDTERPTFVLSGMLQSFEQVDMPGSGNEAHVKLALEVRKDGVSQYSPPEISKIYEVSVPLEGESAGDVVDGLTTCLETIARTIVTDISALP